MTVLQEGAVGSGLGLRPEPVTAGEYAARAASGPDRASFPQRPSRGRVKSGGRVVEGAGEWELPLVRPLDAAFGRYPARRRG
ncbi:hypothetical protein [Kitasatospora sp. SUK 42]|uniref:hypothetical protein n=1 Tax=Kitasatospora sp. SUK 42 TaxID=1588882 RepID=UPI0018C9A8D8|nr:hypothetical protein [Kitasatospora sp. SUK 42]MBV2152170.1 hypothetical protein [Kitasatospora sp. SUK 42]